MSTAACALSLCAKPEPVFMMRLSGVGKVILVLAPRTFSRRLRGAAARLFARGLLGVAPLLFFGKGG